MKKLLGLLGLVLILSGCATNPPLNFSVPNVGVSEHKVHADLRSLTVTLAQPNERKGDMPAAAQLGVPMMWERALTEALNRMAIFRDDADRTVSLSVKVLAIDIPAFGASMTTKTIARYELIDRDDGAIIYTQDITAEGVVPFDYAFVGAIRARESLNRSVQINIKQFLQALETIDVSRPMFPTQAGQ